MLQTLPPRPGALRLSPRSARARNEPHACQIEQLCTYECCVLSSQHRLGECRHWQRLAVLNEQVPGCASVRHWIVRVVYVVQPHNVTAVCAIEVCYMQRSSVQLQSSGTHSLISRFSFTHTKIQCISVSTLQHYARLLLSKILTELLAIATLDWRLPAGVSSHILKNLHGPTHMPCNSVYMHMWNTAGT